jgi:hypothetical protein
MSGIAHVMILHSKLLNIYLNKEEMLGGRSNECCVLGCALTHLMVVSIFKRAWRWFLPRYLRKGSQYRFDGGKRSIETQRDAKRERCWTEPDTSDANFTHAWRMCNKTRVEGERQKADGAARTVHDRIRQPCLYSMYSTRVCLTFTLILTKWCKVRIDCETRWIVRSRSTQPSSHKSDDIEYIIKYHDCPN